jgi:hypothetical protein
MKEYLKWNAIVKCILTNTITGEITVKSFKNLITTVGKIAICRRLCNAGIKANEGAITYGTVGTSATAPAASDTVLGGEVYRKVVSAIDYSVDGSAIIQVYYNTGEANANLKEFGLFGEDAGAGAGSGTLFNHVNIDIAKTASDTLTIETTIELI